MRVPVILEEATRFYSMDNNGVTATLAAYVCQKHRERYTPSPTPLPTPSPTPTPTYVSCPSGYVGFHGDVAGQDFFGRTDISQDSLSSCADECNVRGTCLSFEYSHSDAVCFLNTVHYPNAAKHNDYFFCAKEAFYKNVTGLIEGSCTDGFISESASNGQADCQAKCDAVSACQYISLWLTGGSNWCMLSATCSSLQWGSGHTIRNYQKQALYYFNYAHDGYWSNAFDTSQVTKIDNVSAPACAGCAEECLKADVCVAFSVDGGECKNAASSCYMYKTFTAGSSVHASGFRTYSRPETAYAEMFRWHGTGTCADERWWEYDSWYGFVAYDLCRLQCGAIHECLGLDYKFGSGDCNLRFSNGNLPGTNPGGYAGYWDDGSGYGEILNVYSITHGDLPYCYKKESYCLARERIDMSTDGRQWSDCEYECGDNSRPCLHFEFGAESCALYDCIPQVAFSDVTSGSNKLCYGKEDMTHVVYQKDPGRCSFGCTGDVSTS